MTGKDLNRMLERGRQLAEGEEQDLASAYQVQLNKAARVASETFLAATSYSVVADGEGWLPPEVAEIVAAALVGMSVEQIRRERKTMASRVVRGALLEAGIEVDMDAPAYRALFESLPDEREALAEAIRPTADQSIQKAYGGGMSAGEAASVLRGDLEAAAVWQSGLEARTDFIAVSNGASDIAVRQINAKDGDPFRFKRWLTARDERVRHSHAEVGGTVVPIDQPFTVAGMPMMFPGDPAGGPDNTWNCRCVCTYQESDSSLVASSPPASLPSEAEMTRNGTTAAHAATSVTSVPEVFVPIHGEYGVRVMGGNSQLGFLPLTDGEIMDGARGVLQLAAAVADLQAAVTITVDTDEQPAEDSAAGAWMSDPGIAYEGVSTEDGRFLLLGSTGWRELPLTMMAMVETGPGGHEGAQTAGRIDRIWRDEADDGTAQIRAEGIFTANDFGAEISRLVEEQTLRGISIDLAILDWCFRDPETGELLEPDDMSEDDWMRAFFGELEFAVKESEIMGATVCPFPAFGDARITIQASAVNGRLVPERMTVMGSLAIRPQQTLTASAAGLAPLAPPAAWFDVPEADVLTPLIFTDDGQVYGHVSTRACHNGYPDACVLAPQTTTGFAYFHTGELETAEGDMINVGRIIVADHADRHLGRAAAQRHYGNCDRVGAFVRGTEGVHGVWVAGAVRSDMPMELYRDMRANSPSGDWRDGELIGVSCVPFGGLPVPRTEAVVSLAADGSLEQRTLISAPLDCGCEGMSAEEYAISIEALGALAGVADE